MSIVGWDAYDLHNKRLGKVVQVDLFNDKNIVSYMLLVLDDAGRLTSEYAHKVTVRASKTR